MKRKISILLIIALLLAIAIPTSVFAAKADYVSLGDSNAFGSGLASETPPAPNYYTLFSNYLKIKKGYSAVNLAADGKTTTSIFEDLTADKIKDAKVITLSIGGNNLLGPILQAIYSFYSQEPYKIDPLLPGDQKMAALAYLISQDSVYWQTVLYQLMLSAKPGGALYNQLQNGVKQFLADWPLIMKQINSLAPKARVYVLTMYNPLLKDKNLGPTFASLILPMNSMIRLTQLKYRNVKVVDTSLLFALNPASLSFSLSAPISAESIDPHPTKVGHKLIADTMILMEMFKK